MYESEYPPGWGVPQVKTGFPSFGTPADIRRQAELYLMSAAPRYHGLNNVRTIDWLLEVGYGLRKGAAFRSKKKVIEKVKVISEINKRNPAKAAEQRAQG